MIKILIIEDSIPQAAAIRKMLEPEYEVLIAYDGYDGWKQAKKYQPCLILMDIVMPKMDGFQTLKNLKNDPETKEIPIILLTRLADSATEVKGLTMGAVDYISKPIIPEVVMARVHTHLKLYQYQKQLEQLAWIDGLTEIPNRRYYEERVQMEWHHSMRDQVPISVAMIDIDFFKQYNDLYGHPMGDAALKNVSASIIRCLKRFTDFAARYGGEEFAIILPDTGHKAAVQLAEKIRETVEELEIQHASSGISNCLTISIGGLTTTPRPGDSYQDFFGQVDQMLYEAKKNGRNRIAWKSL